MTPVTVCFARLVRDLFVDSAGTTRHLGGGAWAAFGAALISDRVWLASRIGPDASEDVDSLARVGVAPDALVATDRPTATTRIRYVDEERVEDPIGGFVEHDRMELTLDEVDLPSGCGIYILRPAQPEFWQPALERARQLGGRVCWEMHASTCTPDHLPTITRIAPGLEAVSLNIAEARSLAGTGDPEGVVATLAELNTPRVLLRGGAAGSIAWEGDRVVHVPPPATSVPVDPTGAGNSYTGAYLAALISGDPAPVLAATAASATAIAQLGMPRDRDTARRHYTRHRAASQQTLLGAVDAVAYLNDLQVMKGTEP